MNSRCAISLKFNHTTFSVEGSIIDYFITKKHFMFVHFIRYSNQTNKKLPSSEPAPTFPLFYH